MFKRSVASALALSIAATPLIATAQTAAVDSAVSATTPAFSVTADQQLMIDAWPAEQRARYQSWPSNYQEYYWSLDDDQQKGWWALTTEQKAQVYAMTPEQRAQVWPSIVAQVGGSAMAAATTSASAPTAAPQQTMTAMGYGNSSTGNLVPPPASAMNKTYPVCTRTLKDSCRNPSGV